MNIVRCNYCGGWIGKEEEINIIQTDAKDDDGQYIDYEACPVCGKIDCLMDADNGCNFNEKELIALWNLFGEVAINDDDEIEEDFLGFKAGTNREIIWKWFDERYSGGVVSLMRDAAKVMFGR